MINKFWVDGSILKKLIKGELGKSLIGGHLSKSNVQNPVRLIIKPEGVFADGKKLEFTFRVKGFCKGVDFSISKFDPFDNSPRHLQSTGLLPILEHYTLEPIFP